MFHENVFIPEASLTYVTLIRFLSDMSETHMPNQTVLVSKLLAAQCALKLSK